MRCHVDIIVRVHNDRSLEGEAKRNGLPKIGAVVYLVEVGDCETNAEPLTRINQLLLELDGFLDCLVVDEVIVTPTAHVLAFALCFLVCIVRIEVGHVVGIRVPEPLVHLIGSNTDRLGPREDGRLGAQHGGNRHDLLRATQSLRLADRPVPTGVDGELGSEICQGLVDASFVVYETPTKKKKKSVIEVLQTGYSLGQSGAKELTSNASAEKHMKFAPGPVGPQLELSDILRAGISHGHELEHGWYQVAP